MRKILLFLLTGILAFSLCGLIVACAEDKNPGKDDTGIDDPVKDPDDDTPDPDTDFSEQLSGYDQVVWVGPNGKIDFAAKTYTAAEDFTVTAVTGSAGSAVISCSMRGENYTLSLNEEGALEMKNSQAQVVDTFLADADPFAGAWVESENNTMVLFSGYFFVVSSVPDEDGYFSWMLSNSSNLSQMQSYRAVTSFLFNEETGEPGYFLYVPDMDVSMLYSGSSVLVGQGENSVVAVAYTGIYESVYRDTEGNILSIDLNNSTLTYKDNTYSCMGGFGGLGAGVWYRDGEKDYAVVRMKDSMYLRSEEGDIMLAPYDNAWLYEGEGDWFSANGLDTASFTSESSILLNGQEYPLTVSVADGSVVYSFDYNGTQATIVPQEANDDVFRLQTTAAGMSGYYFRDTVKQSFSGTFTNNAETLKLSDDYSTITVTTRSVYKGANEQPTVISRTGTFEYLPGLGAIAYAYQPYGALSTTLYLTQVNENGIYWALYGMTVDGTMSYAVYASYFTEEMYAELPSMFDQALNGKDDYYTTGGSNADTLIFDHETGVLTVNASELVFEWGYGYLDTTAAEPELYIRYYTECSEELDANGYPVSYKLNLLTSQVTGLSQITYDSADLGGTSATESYFIPASVFQELTGKEWVYNGAYADESFRIDENGDLVLSVLDGKNGLLREEVCNKYTIVRSASDTEERLLLSFTMGTQSYEAQILNRGSVSLGSVVYTAKEYLSYIGTYYTESGEAFSLGKDLSVRLNNRAQNAEEKFENGSLVLTFTDIGKSYTVTLKDGIAAVSADGNAAQEYKLVSFDTKAFIGSYTVGEDTILVYSSAENVNMQPTLIIRVNNVSCSPTYGYANGAQTITFRAYGANAFHYTLSLKDGQLTLTDNTSNKTEGTFAAGTASYSAFVFDGEKTVGEKALTCVVSDGAPVFYLDGVLCGKYVLRTETGKSILELTFGDETVTIANEGGTLTFAIA